MLSRLPDEVICDILSFLPTKISVSTCVLSKRWSFLWAHVPVWDFEAEFFEDETQNPDVIHRVLLWHKAKTMHTLRLTRIDCNEYQLDTWITTAIRRKIRNLYLDFVYAETTVKLHRPLFNCKTVVDMMLGNCKGFSSTGDICLPSLKRLHLSRVEYEDDKSLPHLLSGCPLLQELILDCEYFENCLRSFNISSSTIRMLEVNLITECQYVPHFWFFTNASALRCLRMGNCDLDCITFSKDVASLVEVDICFTSCSAWSIDYSDDPNVVEFFDRLSKIKFLKISSHNDLNIIDGFVGSMEKLNNLTKLELRVVVEWYLLVEFLRVADNLQVLIADVEIRNSCTEPKQVPKCLLSSLKTITIKQPGFEEHELDLVRYLLRNSQVLERMEISPRKGISSWSSSCFLDLTATFKALQRIALFERGSKACQLAFFLDC
ncbi:Unknown protein [Striga hermonthica]|uniref:F-box domain-containing protein n=1 Tax=Striga hermonthica TaxID=68872 RepID=A0A9N7MWL2_STRHE|nr:Unknown protein [Striga hermonthica]